MELTAKDKVYMVFQKTGKRLTCDELCQEYQNITGNWIGYSTECIGRRMREMAEEKGGYKHYLTGKYYFIKSVPRKDKDYNEWYLETTETKKIDGELF